jgi:hypothetical protein
VVDSAHIHPSGVSNEIAVHNGLERVARGFLKLIGSNSGFSKHILYVEMNFLALSLSRLKSNILKVYDGKMVFVSHSLSASCYADHSKLEHRSSKTSTRVGVCASLSEHACMTQ